MIKNKVILVNPKSADHNHRLPVSILQIGASIQGRYEFVFIDGNLESNTWEKVVEYAMTGHFRYFALTVMPGPQLKQAILLTKMMKNAFPELITIWGGYFASNHTEICLASGIVDFIIRGPGDHAFPELLEHLENNPSNDPESIKNVAWKTKGGTVMINPSDKIPEQDALQPLLYDHLELFYPLERYIVKTFIGKHTFMYHSSLGCPYNCSFCGVASIYHGTWKGKSATRMAEEVLYLKNRYRIDALEIIDSNFFVDKSRVLGFCHSITGQNINWWTEGRIDTLVHYTDDELKLIGDAGCRLIFMGAESGNDTILQKVNKGGTLSSETTVDLVKRFREAGIIPELSFVFGFPSGTPEDVYRQVKEDIHFIRKLKKINPATEIVHYLYSPVPAYSSDLFQEASAKGFSFPRSLDEWMNPEWENFDLRRGRITPWLLKKTVRYVTGFETVLTAAFPSKSNYQLHTVGKLMLKAFGKIRYTLRLYQSPFELKVLLRMFNYRLPEKEGFYSE
jgi:anaerobic magnesium-protoporphyrin IX monomethyl ester cyclase